MNIEQGATRKRITTAFQAEQHFRELHKQLYANRKDDEYLEKTANSDDLKGSLDEQFDDFIAKHLFVVTVKFRNEAISIFEPKYVLQGYRTHPLAEYEKLNYRVVKKMMGNNIRRKRLWQPITYAWVDFAGSKVLDKITLDNAKDPHIHALAFVHPNQRLRFQLWMADHLIRRQHVPKISSIVVSQFDPGRSSISECISYCSKGYRKFAMPEDAMLKEGLKAVFPK